jgi:endonuclease-8
VPEGDTVWLAGRRLHQTLAGQPLTRTDFRVPALATVDLSGRGVTEVVSRGKHLLTRIEGGITLHTHFRMDGSWHLYRPATRWAGGPDHQIRLVLSNADWDAVGYRLPVVELLPTTEEDKAVGQLGPDLLAPDFDAGVAVRNLAAAPGLEIGPALLDQRNLAGIGNLYKAEALFLQRVWPWTPSGAVDLAPLVVRAQRLLDANRHRPEQATTGSLRRGEQHWVFERSRRPCRRCSTTVRVAPQGDPPRERLTYWCPTCQPAPAG